MIPFFIRRWWVHRRRWRDRRKFLCVIDPLLKKLDAETRRVQRLLDKRMALAPGSEYLLSALKRVLERAQLSQMGESKVSMEQSIKELRKHR